MIANRPRLSRVNIILIILLVVVTALVFPQFRLKTQTEQEKARLEIRLKAIEADLSEAEKKPDLGSLRQSVAQARAALAKNPFPSEKEATAVAEQIIRYAKENNVTISRWESDYTSVTLRERRYSAISHNLNVEGKADALTYFVKALTKDRVAPVIQSLDISGTGEKRGIWQMRLDLLVYYSEAKG